MQNPPAPDYASMKPISIGLTCWRWQKGKAQAILRIAQEVGVKVRITEHIRGLRREINAEVTGENTDQFIGEFVRQC
jgi:hypothetical protein